jgi:hypothetical protein
VEEMVSGKSVVFKDHALQARSAELHLTKVASAKSAMEESKPGVKTVTLTTTETPKKTKPPKKKIMLEASTSSADSEGTSDDEEPEEVVRTLKKAKTATKKTLAPVVAS